METLSPELEANTTTSIPSSGFSGLDPVLSSLGVLIGLLEEDEDNYYSLKQDWFLNPFEYTKAGIVKNPQEFNTLFAALLGKVGGNALGIPVQNPGVLGNWYPIKYKQDNKDVETGVYLVSYQDENDVTVIGVGVYHAWEFENPAVLAASIWGLIPFVAVDSKDEEDPVKVTFLNEGFPMSLGVAINGVDQDSSLIDINGIKFNGVKVNAGIDLGKVNIADQSPFELGIEILGLQLAGEAQPANRSIADLQAITAEEIMDTAASLFVGGLSEVFPTLKANIQFFPPLFGFSSRVPGTATELPVLKWYDLFDAVSQGGGKAEALFTNWFSTIAADGNRLKTWLSCLSGFLFNKTDVSGLGTRSSPFLISLLNVDKIGKLSLSMGTEVIGDSIHILYPGMNFRGSAIELGTSDIVFILQAQTELARFQLTGDNIGLSPTIDFTAQFQLRNKDEKLPLAEFSLNEGENNSTTSYAIGTLVGGMTLGMKADMMPWFGLTTVNIGDAYFDTLNLLSPGQLADAAAAAISQGLQSLLSFGTGNEQLSYSIGTIIGLQKPEEVKADWPATLVPPFSAEGIFDALMDPIGAWSKYYSDTLTYGEKIDGKSAFVYIIESFAQLLQVATDDGAITIAGEGTKENPWKAGISTSVSYLPAYLTCYQQDADKEISLYLGVLLSPKLEINATEIEPLIEIEAATIRLPKSGKIEDISADWFSRVGVFLRLPKPLETPAVGGMQVKVMSSQLSAQWAQQQGWSWSMFVNQPTLIVDGKTNALGKDLNFDDKSSLDDLVKQSQDTFGPFLVSALGTMLLRTETKAGLFVAGVLGLVENLALSPVFPASGLSWDNFKAYPFTEFKDSVSDINQQLIQVFDSDSKGKSVVGLLAYTMAADNSAPDIKGQGTFSSPWVTPIPYGFNLPIWYTRDKQNLGLGLGRRQLFKYEATQDNTDVTFDLNVRLNLLEYSAKDEKRATINKLPSLACIGTLAKPNSDLVDLGNIGSLKEIQFGFILSIDDVNIVFTPVVQLVDARLGTDFTSEKVTLDDFAADSFSANLQSAFLALLNGALQEATSYTSVTTDSGFKTTYELLEIIGLTIERKKESDIYAINTSGWNGLLADPTNYMEGQLISLLENTDHRKKLFKFLEDQTGITFPTLPRPALQFLSALGICGTEELGFPLLPAAVLEVFTNPSKGLFDRFTKFFEDEEAVRTLAAQLATNLPPKKYGDFTFSANANGVVSFGILKADAIDLKGFVNLYGVLDFDISNETLSFTAQLNIPKIGLTIQTILSLRRTQGVIQPIDFEARLVWGDEVLPSAAPLTVYPIKDTGKLVDDIAKIAPEYALNILLNAVFEEGLLEKYPLIQQIFEALGLGDKLNVSQEYGISNDVEASEIWRMSSILGLLDQPLAWLLSDEVLGNNGQLDISKLVAMLGQLPETSYKDIKLTPASGKGVAITGLPYDFKVDITGENQLAKFNFGVDKIDVINNLASLNNLRFGISLDSDYQPAFSGGLDLEATIPSLSEGFFTRLVYDETFQLLLSQGSPDNPNNEKKSIQFLPFEGWGTIAGQAVATGAAVIIDDLVPKLMNHLIEKYPPESTDAGKFFKAMKDFGDKTDVETLTKDIIDVFSQGLQDGLSGKALLDKIETKAFTWIKERFSETNATLTAEGIVDLLKLPLKDSISADEGMITYIPSDKLPFQLLAGRNPSNSLGLWAGVTLPEMDVLKLQIAPTGVGYNLERDELEISLGINMIVPIEKLNGPALNIEFENNKFKFSFDPLADPENLNVHSALDVELLPNFFGGDRISEKLDQWIMGVIRNVLPRYVSLIALNQTQIKKWLEAPLIEQAAQTSPAILLEATQIIKSQSEVYFLNSFDALAQITPEAFLGNFLFTLLQEPVTVLTFSTDGKILIGQKKDMPGYYGLLIQAPDLSIEAIPNIVFQLGGKNDEWIKESTKTSGNGHSFGDRGLGFYVPITSNGDEGTTTYEADFERFNLVLNNVGFDLVGKNGQPIVDMSRFKLGAVDPRVLFDMQFEKEDPIKMTFGAGLTLDEMGLSLAPKNIDEGGGNNPVAKNVLGSGETDGGSQPTNPQFSVDIGYVDELWVNLRSNTGNGDEVIIPIQRNFGPLYIENIGIGWEGEQEPPRLNFLSTGNFEIAGFNAALQGLTVGIPVTKPTDWSAYTIDLEGFAIDYKGGININAGFLKSEDERGNVMYTGAAILSSKKFSLGAIGSYSQIVMPDNSNSTSLFIFGVLNAPLGGVPAFFVTGVAAGFAYNRSLTIPNIEQVANFPLVKGVAEGSFTEGEDPMKALIDLNDVIKPEVGKYWFAAGLKFTSFQLLDTTALLFLSFGKDFEFNLLGVTVATMPPKTTKSTALAYMELAIKITINPNDGYVSAEAQLTPNSFVLAKEVKLTGGFAFYLWFKDVDYQGKLTIPAGDFALTLGGYHPAFNKPEYYPDVPRLGINWKLSFSAGQVSITGGAYFALCPTAIMAGGYLSIAFNAGPLIAGLDAYANFLIAWEPFYFNVGIGVTVYAGFETSILGVTVRLVAKLGCTLELQGPPVFGRVKVDWYIISFSIPIGNQGNTPSQNNLDWKAFEDSFLPKPISNPASGGTTLLLNDGTSTQLDTDKQQQVVKWTAQTGLEQENNQGAEGTEGDTWKVNPIPWKLTVQSAIPANSLKVTGTDIALEGSKDVGIRPMGIEDSLKAPIEVVLTDPSKKPVDLKKHNINIVPSKNGAPNALWSRSDLDRSAAPSAEDLIIANALFGIDIDASTYNYFSTVPEFPLEHLKFTDGDERNLPFSKTPKYPASALYPSAEQSVAFSKIRESIMNAGVITERNSIYTALRSSHINAPANPDLSVMANFVSFILQDFPVLARIGIYQNNGATEVGGKAILTKKLSQMSTVDETASVPTVVATLQAYRVKNISENNVGLLPIKTKVSGKWTTPHKTDAGRSMKTMENFTSTSSKKIYPGTAIVWEVDSNMPLNVDFSKDQSALIASFDRYGSLLDFGLTTTTQYELPHLTGRILLQGLEAMQNDITGWQRNTKLSQIAGSWSLGDGCLVRVQNGRNIGPESGTAGSFDAEEIIEKNYVKSAGQVRKKGWIQSVFDASYQTIGILIDGDVNNIAVSTAAGKVPTRSGNAEPVAVSKVGNNTLVTFNAPEGSASFYGLIVSILDEATDVIGIYAFREKMTILKNNVDQFSLNQAGIDFNNIISEPAKVRLTKKIINNE